MSDINLLWFRQDLRLSDNPALCAAVERGSVLPVYILDDTHSGDWKMGAASRWWLHHSLHALDRSLGEKLWVFSGDPASIIPKLVEEHGISTVFWNRCYEPWRRQRDTAIKNSLETADIRVVSSNGSLLWEPWENLKADGTAYKVFTPFYRNGIKQGINLEPMTANCEIRDIADCSQSRNKIEKLNLIPSIPWYSQFHENFKPGEAGAHDKLQQFLNEGLTNYKAGRDHPALENVSKLSPHLHFGEISPQRIWQEAQAAGSNHGKEEEAEHFQRELAWR